MGAGGHACRGLAGREAGTDREPAAQGLGERHDIRGYAGTLVSEQFAGASHSGLHLVEDEEETVRVAQFAQRPQERRLDNAHAALAHQRLDHNGRGFAADRPLDRFKIAEWNLIEAFDHGAETVEVFFLTAGGERRQRAAVEGALEGNDAVSLRTAIHRVIFARRLDRGFGSFGAGIAEEDDVGEARFAQPRGDAFGLRNLVQIGDVPKFLRLRRQRRDEMRMGVTECIDGDARGKIEIAIAVGRDEPYALAPLEGEVNACESSHQMRGHGSSSRAARQIGAAKMKCAASPGGTG